MNLWKSSQAALLALALAGCSKGDEGKTAANEAVEGIYSGFFSSDRLQRTFEVTGVIADSGEGHFVNRDTGEQITVVLSVDGNQLAGPMRVYQPTDPSALATVRDGGGLTGNIASRDGIAGSYATDDGDRGTFSLLYDRALYERSSRVQQLTGIWAAESVDERYSVSVGIYEDGTLYGSDSNGCVYAGVLTLPDARFNLFSIGEVSATCGAVAYNGRGWLVRHHAQTNPPGSVEHLESIEFGFVAESKAYYNRLFKVSGATAP